MTLLSTSRGPAPARLETAVLGLCGVRTASAPLAVVLLEVLDAVAVALPADACSVLVRTTGEPHLVRASDGAVATLAADGVDNMRSPLLDALSDATTVSAGRVHVDQRWPVFARRAGGAGLRSVVATGFTVDERTTAVVAHWSTTADAFTAADVADAAEFAQHLMPVLHNAVAADGLARRNENLVHALSSRAVIDQAIGIVMSRTGATAEEAMDRMRSISQREHVKVHEVAQRTVRDAVNRTRARIQQAGGTSAVASTGTTS